MLDQGVQINSKGQKKGEVQQTDKQLTHATKAHEAV